ncbi:type II secretion system F family protein [Candidatus Liberibacter americanus]|uniref:Type II/IV secretion system protein TadC n=1 Tax=Candidatus Liberibacter americanus str. Sao Paulo TaxID=1261131 RepID=U6B3G8_9HYPH|nr:type II secretion system F family protein [Candidatus Liberibacter americanus]AHA27604.1 Type II/IV secretion system protein TadC [Candidatus Liberibacter americanus str. Sao Paulo]EMS36312.1 pilus component protein [Candidatus Liberibacter americanus PW_SP]
MPSYIFNMFSGFDIAIVIATSFSVFAMIYAIVIPYLSADNLDKRMKYIAAERELLRKKQRISLENNSKPGLRTRDSNSLRQLVKKLNLKAIVMDEHTINRLRAAGFRSEYSLNVLLISRILSPCICFILSVIWVFHYDKFIDHPLSFRIIIAFTIGLSGFYLPNIFISNLVSKRQDSIRRAWPDALDLLLICVEAGISVDQALRRVAEEIGGQSVALSEEMMITTAELSFLPSRQDAFENFYNRTQMDCIRNVMQALIQSDRYGTSIGDSLRILVDESRSERMTEAEKKAASLAPKLTVPMIVFFLPVLLGIIIGPAVLNMIDNFK